MSIICSQSLKGGVGKTSLAILMANCIAAKGYKVLFIDLDPNNSSSVYYLTGIENASELTEEKNVFEAINHSSYKEYALKTRIENIDLLASHLKLINLRGIGYNELSKTLRNVSNDYNYVVIDTAPTYGNIELNALKASDIILTPVQFDISNFNTVKFLQSKIYDDVPEKIDNWYIYYGWWKNTVANFPNSIQSQIQNIYEQNFSNILDIHIPHTDSIKNYFMRDEKLTEKNGSIGLKNMWLEVNKLVSMITGDENYSVKF